MKTTKPIKKLPQKMVSRILQNKEREGKGYATLMYMELKNLI